MVNVKEEFRTVVGIHSRSEAVTTDPPRQMQFGVLNFEGDAPETPYEKRAVKLAGTHYVRTAIQPHHASSPSYSNRAGVINAGTARASAGLVRDMRGWDFEIDEAVSITGVSISGADLQQLFVPTGELFSAFEVQSQPRPAERTSLSQRILRAHFLTDVVSAIDGLAKHARTQTAADYANTLFKTMRAFRDMLSHDPFTAIVVGLHDALAYKNRWADFTAEQYTKARDLLVKYGNQDLTPEKALKALASIEAIGFDTTPFEAIQEFEAEG
jgi:hypothetical protein